MMNLRPKNKPKGDTVDYNVIGWSTLIHYLKQWKVDTREFSYVNDGDPISAKTCRKVAHAIADHLHTLPPDHQDWLKDHPPLWCYLADHGGCKQC